jgi:hypothetical protein
LLYILFLSLCQPTIWAGQYRAIAQLVILPHAGTAWNALFNVIFMPVVKVCFINGVPAQIGVASGILLIVVAKL